MAKPQNTATVTGSKSKFCTSSHEESLAVQLSATWDLGKITETECLRPSYA